MPNADFIVSSRYNPGPCDPSSQKHWKSSSSRSLLIESNKSRRKAQMRAGIPDPIRSVVWIDYLRIYKVKEFDRNYEKSLLRVFRTTKPVLDPAKDLLGGAILTEHLCLTDEGYRAAAHIVAIIKADFPRILYCPYITSLTTLLLHHIPAGETLGILNALVGTSLSSRPYRYFPMSKESTKRINNAFTELARQEFPQYVGWMDKLNESHQPLWARWFCDFFVGVVPLNIVFRIIDAYLNEGFKVLVRFGLALLDLQAESIPRTVCWADLVLLFDIKKTNSLNEQTIAHRANERRIKMKNVIALMRSPSVTAILTRQGSLSELLKESSSAFLNPNSQPINDQFSCEASTMLTSSNSWAGKLIPSNIRFSQLPTIPANSTFDTILNLDEWVLLWSWVPWRLRQYELVPIFATPTHGRSLVLLLNELKDLAPIILIIETMAGHIFGVYLSVGISLNSRSAGSGETFLFSLRPQSAQYLWHGDSPSSEASFSSNFTSNTFSNPIDSLASYSPDSSRMPSGCSVVRSGKGELLVGIGDTGCALWFSGNLEKAINKASFPFASPQLAESERFEISRLEAYYLKTPFSNVPPI